MLTNRIVELEMAVREAYEATEGLASLGLTHVIRVAEMAETEAEYAVSLTHDIVEDDIWKYTDLLPYLTETEIDAVKLLCRVRINNHYVLTYEEYIDKILLQKGTPHGELALNVKTYDIFDHLHPYLRSPKYLSLSPRYVRALEKITMTRGFYNQKGEQLHGTN